MQLNAVRTLTVRGQSQGLDRVRADLDGVSASQQSVAQSASSMATATETSARRQLSAAGAFERLMERNDRMIYIQRQLEREMMVVNRAHEQGAIDATRHSQAVDLLQAKYARLAATESQARVQISGTTQAIDAQAAAAHRLAAANDNARGAGSFNTANVASQFQDIAVTAMMGQSPLTIALQQGTQLSAVLGQQGLTGVVKTLGAAFMSIVSPVSLITIGVVALVAAGIQAFANMQHGAEDSTDALEKHAEWLDKILQGYKAAREAAGEARDAALTLPKEAVVSNLEANLRQQEEARQALQERIDATNRELSDTAEIYADLGRKFASDDGVNVMGDIAGKLDALRQIGISAASTREELDAATVAATKLMNEADDPTVKDLASQVLALANQLRAATGEINATTAAIAHMQQQAAKGFDTSGALSQIKSLTPELRSSKEIIADLFNQGASAARTTGQLQDLADAAKKAYDAIDQQDAQREAEKAAKSGTKAIDQQAEAYDNLIQSIDARVAKAEFEAKVIGMAEDATERLRIEFELLEQAKQSGTALDPDTLAQAVNRIADAEKKTRDMNKALADQKRLMDQLGGSAQTLVGALAGAAGVGDNPLVMGLEGALGPLMKGDWIGAAIAGVTSLFVGYIEMEKKHQEAIKAANDNKATIGGFIAQGYGKEVDETAIALERYRKQASEYIKLAEAAGDQALVHRLQDAAAAYRDTLRAQERIDRAQGKVDDDRDRLRNAYERESSALRDVIDQQKSYVSGLQDLKKSLLLDGALSPLSPQDRLIQAQMQFQQTSSAALGGDASAQARLQDAATSYLQQARDFYASSQGYVSIFDQVQSVLDRAITGGTAQISDAERQLSVLDKQVGKLIDINDSVVSVAQAVKKLNADMATLLAAQVLAAQDTAEAVKKQNRELSQVGGKRAA